MKRFFLTVLMALFAFTSFTSTVEAKRLGGGGSSGRQAGRMVAPPSAPMRQAPAPSAPMRQQAQPAPAYPAPAPAQQQARSGMGGMLGGALLGLGVGSMMGNGANAGTNNGNGTAANPEAAANVPAESSGGGSSLLMILAVAGIAFFLYRRFRR
nr:hypothetical protein [uncultured Noviherbaspirillum sp.]